MILTSGKSTMVLLDYFSNRSKNIEARTKPTEILQEGKMTQ